MNTQAITATIQVESRQDGFVAFVGDRSRRGTGGSPNAAIGDLLVGYGMDMGIDVEVRAVDCGPCGNTGRVDGDRCPHCDGFGRRPADAAKPPKGQPR